VLPQRVDLTELSAHRPFTMSIVNKNAELERFSSLREDVSDCGWHAGRNGHGCKVALVDRVHAYFTAIGDTQQNS
jgi:hypothetical protein